MLHERGLLCLRDTRSPTEFLIPRTFCDELVVKGDYCPSLRVSLVVKFNIWLNKTRRVPVLKLIADFHTKQRTKHQNYDSKTAHETTADFFFFAG